ncbi:MAG: hypothetical protein RLZZ292_296 [Bacteroidota bacterium]|jgi:hypothetical protein
MKKLLFSFFLLLSINALWAQKNKHTQKAVDDICTCLGTKDIDNAKEKTAALSIITSCLWNRGL